jgi:hypothetical protein
MGFGEAAFWSKTHPKEMDVEEKAQCRRSS